VASLQRGATCATAMAALLYFGIFQHLYTGATMVSEMRSHLQPGTAFREVRLLLGRMRALFHRRSPVQHCEAMPSVSTIISAAMRLVFALIVAGIDCARIEVYEHKSAGLRLHLPALICQGADGMPLHRLDILQSLPTAAAASAATMAWGNAARRQLRRPSAIACRTTPR